MLIQEIPLSLYALQMKHQSNKPISLKSIMEPFCMGLSKGQEDPFLLVGHLLEELLDQNDPKSFIDPLDVASMAWELGHEPAGEFLERGPLLMYHLMKEDGLLFPSF